MITSTTTVSKYEKFIFYLAVFCIPFQTRVIIWLWTIPFNEWTSGFVYGSDFLIIALFVFWFIRSLPNLKKIKFSISIWLLLAFLLVSAVSIFNSKIIGLSFYRLMKLAEFILFYFYIKSNLSKIFKLEETAWVIVGSGLVQAVIAIGQYLKQGSLGLKIFGESFLNPNFPNVAVFIANGHKYLRAYGTFPHSNVLAAWLLLSLFAFYFLYFKKGEKMNYFWFSSYAILLFAFFFSFSRTVIGIWGISLIVGLWILRSHIRKIIPIFSATFIICAIFALLFWPQVKTRIHVSSDEEAVTQRIYYNQIAGRVSQNHPLGIGVGQFVADLMKNFRHYPPNFYQPVHNIYLIILDEVGFVGLVIFLVFLISIFWNLFTKSRPCKLGFLFLVSCLLFLGLFDHFLWTLQQGSLILWLVLGLIPEWA